MPIPELYLQYAIVARHRELFRQMRRLTVLNNMQHRQLALRMLSLFTYKTLPSTVAWDEKISRAVYRGSCFPTINPWGDREDAEPVFFLRGDVCKASRQAANHSLLDFGLRVDHAFTDGCNPRYLIIWIMTRRRQCQRTATSFMRHCAAGVSSVQTPHRLTHIPWHSTNTYCK